MKSILSLEEIKKSRRPVRNVNKEHREKLTKMESFADWITQKIGTMGFFFIIFFWTIIWMIWNLVAPLELRFDPYPAFVLWLFVSNVVQLFLMPLLLIGQNLQDKHAETRAEADFEINTKAEKEIETILTHLENQNEILERLDKK